MTYSNQRDYSKWFEAISRKQRRVEKENRAEYYSPHRDLYEKKTDRFIVHLLYMFHTYFLYKHIIAQGLLNP